MTDRAHGHMHFVKAIASHASPLLIGQFALMSTTTVDTVVAGYSGTTDLAAVGIGGSIYLAVMITLAGTVQAVTPVAAHRLGAGRTSELTAVFHQGMWLAFLASLLGVLCLLSARPLMAAAGVPEDIVERSSLYLNVLAFGLPGSLIFRTGGCFLNALGRPRALMYLGVANAAVHLVLSPALAFGWLGASALGVVGSAASTAAINIALACLVTLKLHRICKHSNYGNLLSVARPDAGILRELIKVGLPIGFTGFVEVCSFAVIALLIAPLGENMIGANRVLMSLGSLCYSLPFALSVATMALVGRAAGAGDWHAVRRLSMTSAALGAAATAVVGALLMLFARPIIGIYTPDEQVQLLTLSLIAVVAFNQPFNAIQAVASQALRGLKRSKGPMFVQIVCMAGLRLSGGWLLCFVGLPVLGVEPLWLAGFWYAGVAGAFVAGVTLMLMLARVTRKLSGESPLPMRVATA